MSSDISDRARLARLLTTHRVSLYGFILACVRDHEDARQILQSVAQTASQWTGRVPLEHSLLAWARELARSKILAVSQAGSLRHPVDPHLVQRLTDAANRVDAIRPVSEYQTTLLSCLEKLPSRSRLLLALRHDGALGGMDELASRIGREVAAVASLLKQIKKLLRECVEQRITVKFDHGITRVD